MSELERGEGYECGYCRVDMRIMPVKSLFDPVIIRCPKCKQTAQVG